jgi:hypothetical protein
LATLTDELAAAKQEPVAIKKDWSYRLAPRLRMTACPIITSCNAAVTQVGKIIRRR